MRALLVVIIGLATSTAAAEAQTPGRKGEPPASSAPDRQDFPKTAADYARRFIAGKTHRHVSGPHGTQVAYHAPGGKVFLWYPGNPTVLAGEWKVEEVKNVPKLWETPPGSGNIVERTLFQPCYRYPEASYNPATGQRGATWECAGFFTGLGEVRNGDLFRLAKGGPVPFVMAKRRYSYEELFAAGKTNAQERTGAQPRTSERVRPGG